MEVTKPLKQTPDSEIQNAVQQYNTVTLAAFEAFSLVLAQEFGSSDLQRVCVCVQVHVVGENGQREIFFAISSCLCFCIINDAKFILPY